MTCPLCGEELRGAGLMTTHRECNLREVIGGIGHCVAHDYWCEVRHDPDAGLTRRQSSLLVDLYVHLVGVEKASEQ